MLGLEREAAEVDATGLRAHDEAVPLDAELGTVESEHLARHRRLEGVVPGQDDDRDGRCCSHWQDPSDQGHDCHSPGTVIRRTLRACSMRTATTTGAGCCCLSRHLIRMERHRDGRVAQFRCWCGAVAEWRSHRPDRPPGDGSAVRAVAAASPAEAAAHFADRLRFETDCADVHADLVAAAPGIVRRRRAQPGTRTRRATCRVRAACPTPTITPASVEALLAIEPSTEPPGAGLLFVTYCWGPHCNGATRAARALAGLGYPVKEMIGGVAGWRAEGYRLATASVLSD